MTRERLSRNRAPARESLPASAKLFVPMPEDELVAGELELVQAHFAALIARVFASEDLCDIQPGGDKPWP